MIKTCKCTGFCVCIKIINFGAYIMDYNSNSIKDRLHDALQN